MFVGQIETLLMANFSFILQISFVADEDFSDTQHCILADRVQPTLYVLKALLARYVVHDYDAVCFFVETGRHCAEPILAGGVPNLNFMLLSIFLVFFDDEVEADSRQMLHANIFLVVFLDHAGLADGSVANEKNLSALAFHYNSVA